MASGQYTVLKTGIYGVFMNLRCDGCSVPYYQVSIAINGNVGDLTNGLNTISGNFKGYFDNLNVGGYVQLRAGDIVEPYVYASSNSMWVVQTETTFSAMMINAL